jgi:CBS domain-containing protein
VEKTVARLLEAKGPEVWSIRPEATVYEALEVLAEKGIGALPVIDGDDLVGILSERDYARRVILQGKESRSTAVREIMTERVHTVGKETTTAECMEMMTNQRIRHLPVVEGGKVVGLISIGDVVRSVIEEQRFLIKQLESYITG